MEQMEAEERCQGETTSRVTSHPCVRPSRAADVGVTCPCQSVREDTRTWDRDAPGGTFAEEPAERIPTWVRS